MNGAVRTSGGTVGGTGVPPVISPKAKAAWPDGQRQARRLSHRLLLAAVLVATLLVFSIARGQQVDDRGLAGDAAQLPGTGAVRFAAVNLYVDSGEAPLAAWQIDFRDARGVVRIVGIEGGEHAAFAQPPYYDPRAMMHERVVLAAFNTAEANRLPHGRTRIATIHLEITGDIEPAYEVKLVTAATSDGQVIDADIAFEQGTER